MMQVRRYLPLLLLPAVLLGQSAPTVVAPAKPEAQQSPEAAPATVGLSSAAHPAAAAMTLQQRIAKLPPLSGSGVDVAVQSKKILAHLNDMLRFYRVGTSPLQKIGEPSDILYAEQEGAEATQAAQLAFQSAKNEAALLTRVQAGNSGGVEPVAVAAIPAQGQSDAQRIAAAKTRIQGRIDDLTAQNAAITAQLAHVPEKARADLLQKQSQIQGGLELEQATAEAVGRISNFTDSQTGQKGLAGDIGRLENAAPELSTQGKMPAPPAIESFADAEHSGLVSQASVLFQLLSARHAIDLEMVETDRLIAQAQDLRNPFLNVLRSTVAQGERLTDETVNPEATPTTDAQDLAATHKQFDQLTATFRALADAMLPLTQEVVVLQSERGTLSSWRTAVDIEYKMLLQSLLLRLAQIAVGLLFVWGLSEIWSRATVRYVQDMRRRRQLLVVRRVVVLFVGGLIVMFGFVTQFSSLATFAGFISAGIAVGLQTILLSVAAYFFIIGRYGVRVGDRITVAGVTGTVIEVGIARFYMMELSGTGTDLHPTGRVAVFANSVLFQTGTPLYKQLPGTEYAWHELSVKLNPDANVAAVTSCLVETVQTVYEGYKENIEAQQRQIESWIGTAVEAPRIDSQLRMVAGGLQVTVHFPVQIGGAAQTDEAIAKAIMQQLTEDGELKRGVAATPEIHASIKN